MSDTLDPHDNTEGVETPAPEAPEFKITDDKNQVTVGDTKYIRAEALQQARAETQQLRGIVDQIAPYQSEFAEFLNNKRSSRESAVRQAAPASDADYSDDDLKGIATLNNYYTEDGQTLDLGRARQALDVMTRIADRRTARAIEPVARTSAAERASRNRQEALSRQYVDGAPIAAPEFIQQAFDAIPAEYAADPNVANLVQIVAMGLEYAARRKDGKINSRLEPQHSEGGTGMLPGANPRGLTQFGSRAAQARGYTAEQWQKQGEKLNRPNRDGSWDLEGNGL